MSVRAKIVGAGYGGVGAIEILLRHPHVEIVAVVDRSGEGPVAKMWPHLEGFCDLSFTKPDSPDADKEIDCDVVLFCTPDRVGQREAPAEVAKGRRVIDFSGDFRSPDENAYADYARRLGLEEKHLAPELLGRSVYGLPELHREAIKTADVVANPGCFAVGCILGLAPAVREKLILIDAAHIICDAKSGISGAGKKPQPRFHYPEAYENTYAYRLAGHQHALEIETQLGLVAGSGLKVTFTPQVVPMARGILSTLYAPLAAGVGQARVLEVFRDAYADEPFVRVHGPSDSDICRGTAAVRGSNRCNLTVACDERTGTFRVVATIDNLMKGQAGSAIQNLNVMFGLPETAGLDGPGSHP